MKIQPGGWTSGVFLLTLLLSMTRYSTQAPISTNSSTCDWWTEEWDAIVVGAGPAGIIVADRLSEAGKRTLLLEQGGKSYGIVGGTQRPGWLTGTNLSRVDVPGLCELEPTSFSLRYLTADGQRYISHTDLAGQIRVFLRTMETSHVQVEQTHTVAVPLEEEVLSTQDSSSSHRRAIGITSIPPDGRVLTFTMRHRDCTLDRLRS